MTDTEAEWLTCTDPTPMLVFLRDKVSDRKFRLLALACCERIADLITDRRSRAAIEFAERFAEVGVARRRGRPAAVRAADLVCRELSQACRQVADAKERGRCFLALAVADVATATLEPAAWLAALSAATASSVARAWEWIIAHKPDSLPEFDSDASRPEKGEQVPLIHDIVGNPFRPVAFDPRWRTADVTALARGIYEDRAFERMPLLADALMDAGCGDEQVIGHCRSDGPHVRGCWVVDLVLGKE